MNQTPELSPSTLAGLPPLPSDARVAIVAASWHKDIVGRATASLRDELQRQGLAADRIEQFDVPGAFEIPLHAKKLARSGRYTAIVACGLVVDGGIYRHDFVASAVIDGLMRVQLDFDVPVFSAVLTPKDFHEHEVHHQFFSEHFVKKGVEAAHACLRTMASLHALAAGRYA
ncbi:MAG: 6,7-dimethyl-8-ribityllumazine synthase [Burkholderiaceae bacterium]